MWIFLRLFLRSVLMLFFCFLSHCKDENCPTVEQTKFYLNSSHLIQHVKSFPRDLLSRRARCGGGHEWTTATENTRNSFLHPPRSKEKKSWGPRLMCFGPWPSSESSICRGFKNTPSCTRNTPRCSAADCKCSLTCLWRFSTQTRRISSSGDDSCWLLCSEKTPSTTHMSGT